MKQLGEIFSFRNTSMLALLISGVVFFTGCQKDISSEKINSTPSITDSTEGSQSVSAAAASAYEGFGAQATGGAGSSTVYHVTNLSSSGSGSLANGIGSNRTIVFDVSGTITGNFDLGNISYLTIDATGRDITINGNNSGDCLSFDGANTHHCILKGVHFTNAGNDGVNVVDGAHDILITNCTSSGNRDGNIDIAGDNSGQTKNVTVQWCIIGGGAPGASSFSGSTLVTGQNVSLHHNLYVPNVPAGDVAERCPYIHANYSPVGSPNCDFRNNLIYNWGRYASGIGYKATGNFINNYYASNKPGAIDPNADPAGNTASYYVAGNEETGGANINLGGGNHAIFAIPSNAAVTTQDACTAASSVLSNAGPSPRNATDNSIVSAISLANCNGGGGGTTNQPPTANAGVDKKITLPTSSVTLSGSGSDADGSIVSYLWSKVSGTGGTITSPSAASTTITGLTEGTYVFSLKVTDDKGATATDNVTVTVNNSTTNIAPTVSAGANQTITLPVSLVTLTGTATDPDGSIASYLWTKVSGSGGTISSLSTAVTTVTGLIAGSYTFNLKVTDNKGATASANVTVTVNNTTTNIAPTVSAGANQTITLPVSSVTLTGTAADPDGSIASYLWTKVSGSGGTISSPSAATTTVTGLVAGSYTFNLKVTDNKGATASANVNVTVNSATQTGGGYGTLSFSEGYDVSSSVNTDQGRRNSVSFSTYKTGPGSFRSEVRAGDASLSGGFRSEMPYTGTSQNPTEGVVEYDEFYENWSGFDGGGTNISWNPQTSGASAIVSLQTYAGKFDVVRALGSSVIHQSGTLMSLSSNTWYKLRWEFKWSTGTDGYVRLYINDALYYSFTGKTADGSGQTLRIGQSRWPNSGNTMQTTSVCYYDNLKVYKK